MPEQRKIPTLFVTEGERCGCGSCVEACPKRAIEMYTDSFGYRYPNIDADACIRCGRCKKVCGFQRRLAVSSEGPFYAAATQKP